MRRKHLRRSGRRNIFNFGTTRNNFKILVSRFWIRPFLETPKTQFFLWALRSCSIQQNLNPPIRVYDTKELFAKMNRPDSKFLGIKTVPFRLPKVVCSVVKI